MSTSKEPFLYLLYNASINTEKKITVNGPDTCRITGVQVNGVEDTDASSATTDVSYDKATFSFKASAKGRYSIQVSVENPSTGNIYDLTTTIVLG
ncbi:hypothetical protein [Acetanaerobacterium elongatum]|uniref:hypothetical protein n=1 Tax=Acetanaerobacterium elongatum TaxID=258515 RepID=UPI000B8939E6|nr:hypothetical protein [Acetanaerobacterium elongatum]